jgi:hypothetical protein
MLNEGLILNDTTALMKSEIVKQIRRLGSTTADALERAVFTALTGQVREDVDWDIPDNTAGYATWIRSLDNLIEELIEDGYILREEPNKLAPTEAEPQSSYSHLAYPKQR